MRRHSRHTPGKTDGCGRPSGFFDGYIRNKPELHISKDDDGDHRTLKQKITGFHEDEEGDWVADLECGHQQHVRHKPPWMVRPWIETPEGRESRVGVELDCQRCDEMNTVWKKEAGA